MAAIFKIKTPHFEGPFDLLLFFIERDEIDIYDIPIHQIIKEFFEYIRNMEELDMEMASEFILFASTLMRIKARMLLPRREIDDEGNEIDPREELVARLLEYKKFKEISQNLGDLEFKRQQLIQRALAKEQLSNISQNIQHHNVTTDLSMYELLKAFQKVLDQQKLRAFKPQHVVVQYNYTVEGQKNYILNYMEQAKETYFDDIFGNMDNRVHAIFTFLSILELVQLKKIKINVGPHYNSFQLKNIM